jgi:signal transduction histidine kinase
MVMSDPVLVQLQAAAQEMNTLLQRTRYLNVWLGCLPALLAFAAYTISAEHIESVRATLATDNFIGDLSTLFSSVKDAETGQRGYLLTGRELYLQPYENSLRVLDRQLSTTEKEAFAEGVSRPQIARIRDLVTAKIAELRLTLELKRTKGVDAALHEVDSGRGQRYMNQLRDSIAEIISAQRKTLLARLEHQRRDQLLLEWVLGIGVGSGLFTLYLSVRTAELYRLERDRAETEIRLANETLELRVKERTGELERSNSDLLQFAYIASHDLQEPLRTIGSYIGLISRRYSNQFDEAGQTYLRFAVEGASRMQTLINDLLQYSRAGTQAVVKSRVPAEQIVTMALRNLEVSIRESGALIHCSELPVILSDGPKLTQVFQNLIGNALKFRKPGLAPEVTIRATRESDVWVFTVSDNGIGFEEKYTDRIFQVFQRLHGLGKYPGNGIGLAISRRIVEHHGGRLWAVSTPGQGSAFSFSIPADAGSVDSELKPAGSSGKGTAKKVATNV